MSLQVDGVWRGGLWASTVWAAGVWREGAPPAPLILLTVKVETEDTMLAVDAEDRMIRVTPDDPSVAVLSEPTVFKVAKR